jgi:hypothetical protein
MGSLNVLFLPALTGHRLPSRSKIAAQARLSADRQALPC